MPEVSKEFDVYWNSASAYPASGFVGPPMPDGTANLEAKFAANARRPRIDRAISRRCARRRWCAICSTGKLALEWATAEVVYDDPAKTLDTTERTDVLLFPELDAQDGPAAKRRSTSSRHTSCPAPAAPSCWRRWPNAA